MMSSGSSVMSQGAEGAYCVVVLTLLFTLSGPGSIIAVNKTWSFWSSVMCVCIWGGGKVKDRQGIGRRDKDNN